MKRTHNNPRWTVNAIFLMAPWLRLSLKAWTSKERFFLLLSSAGMWFLLYRGIHTTSCMLYVFGHWKANVPLLRGYWEPERLSKCNGNTFVLPLDGTALQAWLFYATVCESCALRGWTLASHLSFEAYWRDTLDRGSIFGTLTSSAVKKQPITLWGRDLRNASILALDGDLFACKFCSHKCFLLSHASLQT